MTKPMTSDSEQGKSWVDPYSDKSQGELLAQSEAPSVDSQIDEVFDWLLASYVDTDNAYMIEEMDEDRPIFRAKINRLIIEAELRGFDKAFDSHDYDGLREYRAALSNNLSKGDVK